MSGIGGIFNLDGDWVNRPDTEQIAESLKQRGPDGLRVWENGSVVLIHSHFWTTPEEVGEEQPISKDSLTLTADARIDNREELLPLLNDYLLNKYPSDAEVILAAYQKWGDNCPRYLIGDFAFALWDDDAQRLFCVRDPVGVRLFNYSMNENTFIFGSSVGAVISALKDLPKINLPFINDLLANRWDRWVHETGYQSVFRLPPAYYLTVNSDGIALKRYWTFGADQCYHFDTDEQYISCFRKLLWEAVRARLRSPGPVAVAVSGGLDSSSIACIVNDLTANENVEISARMYSHVYEQTPLADEREFLKIVTTCCPHLSLTQIISDNIWALQEFGDDNGYPLDEPEYSDLRAHGLTLNRFIRKDGGCVGIDGHGGDNILNTETYRYCFFLKDLDWNNLFSELRYFCPFRKPHRIFFPPHRILTYALISPRFLKKIVIYLEKKSIRKQLSDFLVSSSIESDSPIDLLPPSKLKSRSALWIYDNITGGFNSALHVAFDISNAYSGVEWRHPYFDRRLIDFMLSSPPSLNFKKGHSRYLLRLSMAGLLPDKIRMRKSKATIQELLIKGLKDKERPKIQSLINESRLAKFGIVDANRLSRAWESFWDGKDHQIRFLTLFLCAEAWLRYQENIRNRILR